MSDKKSLTKNRYKYNPQNFNTLFFKKRQFYSGHILPHWHDFFELEIILGNGTTTIDDNVFNFEKGCMCLLTPACIHSYDLTHSDFLTYSFKFDIKYFSFENVVELISQTQNIFLSLSEDDIKWYLRLIDDFCDEYDKTRPSSQVYCLKILEFLFMDIRKKGIGNISLQSSPSNAIQKAVLYIQKNFRKDIHIKEVSDHVFLSEAYFSNLFHQEIGCTYSEYVIKTRLKNACNILIHTTDPVTEIAHDSGFKSSKHFLRTFKKHYGITPLEYRKKYKQTENQS